MDEKTTLRCKVGPAADGRPLLDYVAGRFRYQDREAWAEALRTGTLLLNGLPADPERPLRAGDRLAYTLALREPEVDRDIRLLHEEDSFLVAEKPGWLPSHADGNFITNTFIHLLGEMLKQRGWGGKARLVHRLDRETSGLMAVAKTRDAARSLSRQFEEGTVTKAYWAIARDRVGPDGFTVEGVLGPDPGSEVSVRQRVLPAGTPGAKASATRFTVLRRLRSATLLLCEPQTGRTGQIRAHLAHAGHPLLHDKLYGRSDGEFLDFVRRSKSGFVERPPRHFLHAGRLGFRHPVTGEPLSFESELPKDMRDFLESE